MLMRGQLDRINLQNKSFLLAVAGSVLLSFLAFYSDPVINRDGMLYIDMARNIANGVAVNEQFDWPFFSYFLSGVFWLSPFGDIFTAILVMVAFSAGATGFLALLLCRLTSEKYAFMAVLVALALPAFNENRAQVLRDWPAWFFSLSTIYFAIRFLDKGKLPSVLIGGVCLFMAVLCRLELVVLGMAWGLAWCWGKDWKMLFLFLAAPVLVLVLLWFGGIEGFSGRFYRYLDALDLANRYNEFMALGDAFAEKFLNEFSDDYGGQVLFWGLVSIIPAEILKMLGPLCAALLFRHVAVAKPDNRLYVSLFVIWFAVLLLFLTTYFFVSSRYVVLLALSVLPWLFVRIVGIYQCWPEKWRRAAVLVLILTAVSTTYSSSAREKMSIKLAGEWLENQSRSVVYFNDAQVSFYAGEGYFITEQEEPTAPSPGGLLVWRVDRKAQSSLINKRADYLVELRVFDTGGDDVVIVMSPK